MSRHDNNKAHSVSLCTCDENEHVISAESTGVNIEGDNLVNQVVVQKI